MTITNHDLFALDQLIGRYVGGVPANAPPEMRELRKTILERVRKYTKFSYGLGRNISIIRPYLEAVQSALKNEAMEAFHKDMAAVAKDQDTTPEEKEEKFAEVRKEHQADQLHETAKQQEAELLDMAAVDGDGNPPKFYRIPVAYLPGWNDPEDLPDEERTGAVTPTDISHLLDMGILYDPSDEETPA